MAKVEQVRLGEGGPPPAPATERSSRSWAVATLTARRAAPLVLMLVVGCASKTPCSTLCPEGEPAQIELSCDAATAVTGVTLSGACSAGDASYPGVVMNGTSVDIYGSIAGVCHVSLSFASDFTYSTDVTFVSQTPPAQPGCGQCSAYTMPTESVFSVEAPESCAGARPDAAVDASFDAATQARDAAGE